MLISCFFWAAILWVRIIFGVIPTCSIPYCLIVMFYCRVQMSTALPKATQKKSYELSKLEKQKDHKSLFVKPCREKPSQWWKYDQQIRHISVYSRISPLEGNRECRGWPLKSLLYWVVHNNECWICNQTRRLNLRAFL